MENLFAYFIQINVYLVAIFFIYKGIFQPLKNYKISRPFLLFGIASSLLLPWLSFNSFHVVNEGYLYQTTLQEISVVNDLQKTTTLFTWRSIFTMIYLTGMLLLLIRTVFKIASLFRIKANSIQRSNYFELNEGQAAYSFFGWIFIGSDYSNNEIEILLRHERVHVKRKHSIDILICEALKIVFWPNIVVLKFSDLFRELHEYEADERSWQNDDRYLHLLLKQNFNQFPFITNQFKSSHLKLRIMRLKNQFTNKLTPIKVGMTALLFAAVLFINQNLKAGSTAVEIQQEEVIGVDKAAEFPGGQVEMFKFIQGNIIFPKSMAEKGLTGKVFIKFIVEADGKLSNFKAIRSPHEDFTAQALKMMKKMPKWTPAKKDGKKVKMELTLPINFEIPAPPAPSTPPTPPTN